MSFINIQYDIAKNFNNKTFLFKIGHFKHLGGAEVAAIILAKKLKTELNAKIIFIGGNDEGPVQKELEQLGFTTKLFNFRIKGTKLQRITDYIRFTFFIRRLKPDFILPYVGDNNKMVLPIWRFTGARYCWWMQQDEGRGLYKTKFEKWLISKASDVVSNSKIGLEFIAETYGIPKDKIIHYNNVIAIPASEQVIPYWREELSINADTIIVSMIANISGYKDHATLFKSWRIVQDHFENQNQKIMLLLAGKQYKQTTNELKVLGFDLGISHSVKFLGAINKTNELIYESDLVVHSSLTEGCPNAICEAMALNKMIVATDISGNREALTGKYEKDCLVSIKDHILLSDKIICALENPELMETIGTFNRQQIIENYNEEQMYQKFLDCFSKAL